MDRTRRVGVVRRLDRFAAVDALVLPLVTLVSLVANLVVVPIAFFVLAGALLSLVTAPSKQWAKTS